jgi:uncharacterized YigZ family protein
VVRRLDHEIAKIQGSRFLATLVPAPDVDVVVRLQSELRAEHPHSVHVCFAFVGETDADTRFSDDGEPSKTAGFPMLRVLLGASLRHSGALVTRYFGGTKLGTGGLVRAYTLAVREAVERASLEVIEALSEKRLQCGYAFEPRVRHALDRTGARLIDVEYTAEHVTLRVRHRVAGWPELLAAFGAALGSEVFVLDDN